MTFQIQLSASSLIFANLCRAGREQTSFQGSNVLMLNHHIDLVPGQSFRVGNLRVTLVRVEGENVAFEIEDDDFGPAEVCSTDCDSSYAPEGSYEPELMLV